MKSYVIDESEIEECSKRGIVACWNSELNKPVVIKNAATDALFLDREVVEITEEE